MRAPKAARRAAARDRSSPRGPASPGKACRGRETCPQRLHGDRERRDAADADYFFAWGVVVLPPGREFGGHPQVGVDLVVAAFAIAQQHIARMPSRVGRHGSPPIQIRKIHAPVGLRSQPGCGAFRIPAPTRAAAASIARLNGVARVSAGPVRARRSDSQPPRDLRGPCPVPGGRELTAGRAGPAFTTRERGGWCTYRAVRDVPGQIGLVNVFRPPQQTRIKRRQVPGGLINEHERPRVEAQVMTGGRALEPHTLGPTASPRA